MGPSRYLNSSPNFLCNVKCKNLQKFFVASIHFIKILGENGMKMWKSSFYIRFLGQKLGTTIAWPASSRTFVHFINSTEIKVKKLEILKYEQSVFLKSSVNYYVKIELKLFIGLIVIDKI